MSEVKVINDKEYEKLKVKSITLNGKAIENSIKAEDIAESENIVINIVVERNKEEN